MKKLVIGGGVALIVLLMGGSMLPGFNSMFGLINTTGWNPLNKAIVTGAPYIAIIVIGYCVWRGYSDSGNR
jgi:hypothetical protein